MKMKQMIKKDIIISIVTIVVLICGITTVAYSLFFQIEETEDEVVNFGDLKTDFASGSNQITRTNDYPRTDVEGAATDPYTFTITNTGTLKATYSVVLTDDNETITADNLTKVNDNFMKFQIDSKEPQILGTISDNVIERGTLEPSNSITYNLRFWLKSDAPNQAIGTSMIKKVKVKAEYIPDELSSSSQTEQSA